jgi:hypothetical protein
MLGDPTSIYFQTELRFVPIDELRFGKGFVRELYIQLAKPGGYLYEDLSVQEGTPTMSSKRVTQTGDGSSVCKIGTSTITIEETEPEITVDDFTVNVETVLKAVKTTKAECAPIFGQKCTIRSIAKPQKSKHSVNLLAGKVTNVLNAINPFKRPPQFFGLRFRFPPVRFVSSENEEKNEESEEDEKPDFIAVRFETYGRDIDQVWIEVTTMNIFPNAIEITETEKIRANIQSAHSFLTTECIDFLNQFDERSDPPGEIEDDKKED